MSQKTFIPISSTRVVFQIVLNKSEQSLECNWMPEISTARTLEEQTRNYTRPSSTIVLGPVQQIVNIQKPEGTFLDEQEQEKMNRVSVIVRNPAYLREVELDEDEGNPVDLVPLVSGNTPITTVPASEDEDVAEEVVEDKDEDEKMEDIPQILREVVQYLEELNRELRSMMSPPPKDTSSQQPTVVPNVDVWDTGKALEQEYRMYPASTRKEVSDRLSNQVWDLLRILQEWIDQQTYNSKDIKLIDGLKAISVMHFRLGRLTEKVLKRRVRKPYK